MRTLLTLNLYGDVTSINTKKKERKKKVANDKEWMKINRYGHWFFVSDIQNINHKNYVLGVKGRYNEILIVFIWTGKLHVYLAKCQLYLSVDIR